MNRPILTIIATVFTFVCSSYVLREYEKDEILSLPGYDGKLPSRQYSGYLNVGMSNLHYWFVESELSPAIAVSAISHFIPRIEEVLVQLNFLSFLLLQQH